MAQAPRLVFGIYPGGMSSSGSGLTVGPPDLPARIESALSALQPAGRPFIVRGYLHYTGQGRGENLTPAEVTQYLRGGRRLDLVLCYQLRDADSSNPSIFYQFGVLRDDYTPKPAFEVYRRLIAELGVEAWPA